MSVALFWFVSARLSTAYGTLAAMFPMLTNARYYADEARPYGLELGFAALALLCWQRATMDRNRGLALIGLPISLAAATGCHYYGVLISLPLALAELVRTANKKHIDFAIWGCFAAAALPLAFCVPLMLNAAKLSSGFYAQPHWHHVSNFYHILLTQTEFQLVVVVSIMVVANRFAVLASRIDPAAPNASFPGHELAAAIGFIALPFIGFLLGKFVTRAFNDRYVLAAVVGVSILFAQASHKMLDGRRWSAGIIGLFFLAFIGMRDRSILVSVGQQQKEFEQSLTLLRLANKANAPIVAADPHTFTEFSHYAPIDIASQMVYLADSAIAYRILGFDSIENNMIRLVGPTFNMKVVPLEEFVTSKPRFLVYGELNWLNWIIRALEEKRYRLELKANVGEKYLFTVTPPEF
jgi:hypothetical protein